MRVRTHKGQTPLQLAVNDKVRALFGGNIGGGGPSSPATPLGPPLPQWSEAADENIALNDIAEASPSSVRSAPKAKRTLTLVPPTTAGTSGQEEVIDLMPSLPSPSDKMSYDFISPINNNESEQIIPPSPWHEATQKDIQRAASKVASVYRESVEGRQAANLLNGSALQQAR